MALSILARGGSATATPTCRYLSAVSARLVAADDGGSVRLRGEAGNRRRPYQTGARQQAAGRFFQIRPIPIGWPQPCSYAVVQAGHGCVPSRSLSMAADPTAVAGNFFSRFWRGEYSLPFSYWAIGFLGNIAVS